MRIRFEHISSRCLPAIPAVTRNYLIYTLCYTTIALAGAYGAAYLYDFAAIAVAIVFIAAWHLAVTCLFPRDPARMPADTLVYWALHATMLLGLYYLWHTAFTTRANDIGGHVAYLMKLATSYVLPEPYGWQSQQPPLYYGFAAILFRVGEALDLTQPLQLVRHFSLALYTGFQLLGVAVLRRYLRGGTYLLAAAMLLAWPENLNLMVRISNDVGIVFCDGLALYGLVRWHLDGARRGLALAVLAGALALATKGTGVMIWGAIGLVMLAHLARGTFPWGALRSRTFLLALLPLSLACAGINFGRVWYYRTFYNAKLNWFMNVSAGDIPAWLSPNRPVNYFYLDYTAYLTAPFYGDKSMQYFWNAFLKTLLFGEWNWPYPVIALCMAFLLLAVLAMCATLLWRPQRPDGPLLPLGAMALCMIGALIASRVVLPWDPQCNARYMFAVVAIIACAYATALDWHRREGRVLMYAAGLGVGLLFVAGGLILQIGMNV